MRARTMFRRQYKNRVADVLNQLRYRRILEMVAPYGRKKLRLLDVGCAKGLLTHMFSDCFDTVGVEIQKTLLRMKGDTCASFLAGTAENLPFKRGSFDLILCASVLEHIRSLENILLELKSLLSEKGVLIVGYPVETWLFKFIWRIASPQKFKCIDMNHPENIKDYWNNPRTHKQTYRSIRKALNEKFKTRKVVRLPFNVLPSLFAYYECAILQAC